MRYLLVLTLAGCAASSGVVPIGNDTYMVGNKAVGLGASDHDATADAYREANMFCAAMGRKIETVGTQSNIRGFARFPSAKVEFKCVPK